MASGSDPFLTLLNYRTAPMKHVLSPADILFNRYMKTRMPSVLEAAVRVTGDLEMHKETDKAKQTAQSASQPEKLEVLRESAAELSAARSQDPHGRDRPGHARALPDQRWAGAHFPVWKRWL